MKNHRALETNGSSLAPAVLRPQERLARRAQQQLVRRVLRAPLAEVLRLARVRQALLKGFRAVLE